MKNLIFIVVAALFGYAKGVCSFSEILFKDDPTCTGTPDLDNQWVDVELNSCG